MYEVGEPAVNKKFALNSGGPDRPLPAGARSWTGLNAPTSIPGPLVTWLTQGRYPVRIQLSRYR
jgi:hypothetical protein